MSNLHKQDHMLESKGHIRGLQTILGFLIPRHICRNTRNHCLNIAKLRPTYDSKKKERWQKKRKIQRQGEVIYSGSWDSEDLGNSNDNISENEYHLKYSTYAFHINSLQYFFPNLHDFINSDK